MTRRCPAAAAMSEGAKNKDDCKLVLLGREDDEVSLWKIGRQLQKLYWSMRNKKEKKRKEKKRKEKRAVSRVQTRLVDRDFDPLDRYRSN
jgi:hypothetical protein